MGVCNSEGNRVNRGIGNVEGLRSFLNNQIGIYPFGTLNILAQSQMEAEFLSGNYENPYEYLKTKNTPRYFIDLYKLCYLKCLPFLGNIIEDDKTKNLLFYRLVVFLLSTISDTERKKETAERLISISFDSNQDKYDIHKLKYIIQEVSGICFQILIYIGLIRSKISDEELNNVIENEFYKVERKYRKSELDDFFMNKIRNLTKYNIEILKKFWVRYITEAPINNAEITSNEERNQKALYQSLSTNRISNIKNSNFIELPSSNKGSIINNLVFMFDKNNLFDSLFGLTKNFYVINIKK